MWSSENGNYFFMFDDTEKLTLGGEDMKTDRILVYTTGNVEANGSAVLNQCLVTGQDESTSTDQDVGNFSVTNVTLDPGCTGNFVHVQEGTQWWYKNVLVRANSTTTWVQINDYGYEWYETQANNCVRRTNTTKDDSTAELFVEYTVTVTNGTHEVHTWTK